MADTPQQPRNLEQLISPPAIAMIVLASLSLLFSLVEILFHPTGQLLAELLRELDFSSSGWRSLISALGIFSALSSLAVSCIVLFGSLQMLRRRSWALALTAATLMLIPCLGPCCPLGIPVGAWALFVLVKPEVRQALQGND